MLDLHVHPGDALPLYQQLVRQVEAAVAGGKLSPGDKLPSHRELALALVVAPLTVKKAYDQLEAGGLLETRRGRGTFVAQRPRGFGGNEARNRLRRRLKEVWREAQLMDLSMTELITLLREARGEAKQEDRGDQRDRA